MKRLTFSATSIESILGGIKHESRRIVNPQPIVNIEVDGNVYDGKYRGFVHPQNGDWQDEFARRFAPWKVGDKIGVRETYALDGEKVIYRATYDGEKKYRWISPIFMPNKLVRIVLEVTYVKIKRLHDISYDEIKVEGVEVSEWYDHWCSINGKDSWEQNPYVWVIGFVVDQKNFEMNNEQNVEGLNVSPNDANNVLVDDVRPFDDLIKEIEFDGEKFVPAQKIAALCFNYNENTVKNNAKMWVNNSYDYTTWYVFETNILKPKKHQCSIGIRRNFDISAYHRIGDEELKSNVGMPPSNQVEIVKNLIRWGFVACR